MVTVRRPSRLSAHVQLSILQHFVAGTPARAAAQLVGVNRHTTTLYYRKLREVIAQRLEAETPELFDGEVEVDESYFGGVRRGRRGRGVPHKVAVFGLLKRGGKVHAVVIRNVQGKTLMPIMRSRILPHSIVYTDAYSAYGVLDVSEFRHWRINHQNRFANGRNHINGIENFWSQAKRHLRRYNGIPPAQFPLYLKECEWRFNYRPASRLLRTLAAWMGLPEVAR